MDEEYLKKLVVSRLKTLPPKVDFSVGDYGDFTRDEIIKNVMEGTPAGKVFATMEIKMLLDSPKIVGWLSEKEISSHYSKKSKSL